MLSNIELMLLQIISQEGPVSGYRINKIVTCVDYRSWADIGKTSIYKKLKSLEEKEFISSKIDRKKRGRGPLPIIYNITSSGTLLMKEEIMNILETTREHNKRFHLALSAIQLFSKEEIRTIFLKRKSFLTEEAAKIQREYESVKDCIPLGPDVLYKNILHSIRSAIEFADKIHQDIYQEQ